MDHNILSEKPSPGMRFECTKRWEDMGAMDRGRFCDSCQKPVIDFTGWSREELLAWFRREPETCGVFERHQVDTRYVPIEDVGKIARRGLLAMSAAFSLNAMQAQAPRESSPTEQTVHTPSSEVRTPDRPRCYSINPKLTWAECPAIPDRTPRRKRVRAYVSGSFPFLHVGKRRFRTIGCPIF